MALTFKAIKKAINNKLIAKFPTIKITSKDVEEGFQRPSFFVQFDNVNRESYRYYSIRSMTIRIYFFPSDLYNYSLEVLDVQQKLEELFDLTISVEDRVITISNTSSLMVDKVLEFDINIEYYEEPLSTLPDGQEPPLMQELSIDV